MDCRLPAGSLQREYIVWIPRWASWDYEGQVCSADPWVYLSLQKPGTFYISTDTILCLHFIWFVEIG